MSTLIGYDGTRLYHALPLYSQVTKYLPMQVEENVAYGNLLLSRGVGSS